MNMASWQDYLDVRRKIKEKLPEGKCNSCLHTVDKTMTTNSGVKLTNIYPVAGGRLKTELNECWLWHGTKPMAADSIVASDFQISKAGSHLGSLYGRGIYLAE